MKYLERLVVGLVLWAVLLALPAAGHLPTSAANLAAASIDQRPGAAVPLELTFRDERSRLMTLWQAIDGKVTLLVFADYDCPQLCHHLLEGLVTGLKAVPLQPAKDYTVAVVSLDPTEGPAQARTRKAASLAGESNERAAGWLFLTSTEATIRALADAVGFGYAYDATHGTYAHGAGIVVLTPSGHVSRYLLGVSFKAQDLRLGLLDAAGGGIGTVVDQLVLRCYRYDPVHGRYSLAVMRLVQAVGILTMLLVGLLMWRLNRSGARPQP